MDTRIAPRFPFGPLAVLLVAAACGDTTGPAEHFMTAVVNDEQWSAGSDPRESPPSASVADGRLAILGAGQVTAADHLTIGVHQIPARPGTYAIEMWLEPTDWDAESPPAAILLGSRGTLGSPGFEWLTAYSQTGEVTIDAIDESWVVGTFWFRAGGGSLGSVNVSNGRYRLRLP